MPLIYSSQRQENSFNIRNSSSSREVAEAFRRYVHDNFRPSLLQGQSEYISNDTISSTNSNHSSDTSPESNMLEDDSDEEDDIITTSNNIIDINITESSEEEEDEDDDEEEDDEEDEEEEDDNTTVTESFTRSRVDVYRLAIRTNSEILEDLAAIIRILRQINAIYRVFNNSNTSNRFHSRRRALRRRPRPVLLHHRFNDDDTISDSDEEYSLDDDEEDEANKLLEAGLEDLQAALTMENNGGIKRQSTLALLSLITYQRSHCSDNYLRHYLDPNGEYNPELSVFAAATYDEEEEFIVNQTPKSCKDIMNAAEELYGPDWLNEFHTGKDGALRKMLEKLTFVAQIRLKIRDSEHSSVIR